MNGIWPFSQHWLLLSKCHLIPFIDNASHIDIQDSAFHTLFPSGLQLDHAITSAYSLTVLADFIKRYQVEYAQLDKEAKSNVTECVQALVKSSLVKHISIMIISVAETESIFHSPMTVKRRIVPLALFVLRRFLEIERQFDQSSARELAKWTFQSTLLLLHFMGKSSSIDNVVVHMTEQALLLWRATLLPFAEDIENLIRTGIDNINYY